MYMYVFHATQNTELISQYMLIPYLGTVNFFLEFHI